MAREMCIVQLKRLWKVDETLICDKNLYLFLHKLLAIKGLSKVELARYLGISRTSLYHMMQGKLHVFHSKIEEICKEMGITTDDLMWMCEIVALLTHRRLYRSYREFNFCMSQTIYILRRTTGILPSEFAELIGASPRQYYQMESGAEWLMNPCVWAVLCKANVHKNELLSGGESSDEAGGETDNDGDNGPDSE